MPRKHTTITIKRHEHLMAKLNEELTQRLRESHSAMLDRIVLLRNENPKLKNENEKLKQRGVGADIIC